MTAAAVALVALATLAAGCGGHGREVGSPRLLDGGAAAPVPQALRAVDGDAIASRVRVQRAAALGAPERACIDGFRPEFRIAPTAPAVTRVGAIGASVTVLDAARRFVLGCDRTAHAARLWCARSVGRLVRGRLRDARVDILCRDARGRPVGFGWVEPARETRWIVVRSASMTQLEEVAAGLPVRVATTEVDAADASATFPITEYDRFGRNVRAYTLDARVAG